MKPFLITAAIIAALLYILWLGLQIQPKPFTQPALTQGDIKTIPLPDGLPAPVEHFYRTVYGDQIPVIESVVITGRGTMRPFGV